jgi:tRNA(Ile)-lysidine synthase
MIEEFRKFILDKNLVNENDRVLMAVSGGIDSMVMANLFISCEISTGIAHCNFNLRGEESVEDEKFVEKFAMDHKIPFHTVSFDTTGFATEKNISIQMAARELRYRWFEEIRILHGYDSIALAHNLNDNTETFLINLTRGTGIAGLTGMKPKHMNLIRPLLFATRNAIAFYRQQHDINFREDRSNSEIKYKRNKLRHVIIPLFREINPSFDQSVEETAEKLGDVNEIFTAFISDIRNKTVRHKNNLVVIKIKELINLSPKRTILFELFRPYGLGSGQIDDLISLSEGKTGNQIFTASHRLLKNRNEIIVSPRDIDSDAYYEISSLEEFRKVPGIVSAESVKITDGYIIPRSSKVACLDLAKISFPVVIRRWAPGDTFYPLGMKKKKKLSDYFIDKKYSILEKENCLLLQSVDKIAWILGDRIDNRFRITSSSRNALLIKVKK